MNSPRRMPALAGVLAILLYLLLVGLLVLAITGVGALVVMIVRYVFN